MKDLKRYLTILLMTVMVVMMMSCDRRPLEIYYTDTARIRIDVDWMTRFGKMPTGMTVLFYPTEGGTPQSILTNDVKSVHADLRPGSYYMVIFNQSTDEFGSMTFSEMQDFLKSHVNATQLTQIERGAWDASTRYMQDPELIGNAIDTLVITDEMMEGQLYFTDYRNRDKFSTVDTTEYVYREIVDSMICRLHVNLNVSGMKYIRSLRGSITGMADGFQMGQRWRTEGSGILYLDSWQAKTVSGSETVDGMLRSTINTFGLPHGKELLSNRVPTDNVLTLCFTLIDGKTKVYSFNVGQLIHYIHHEDIEGTVPEKRHSVIDLYLTLGDAIAIPKTEGGGGSDAGSGFDAEVEPWEDGGTIDIGM